MFVLCVFLPQYMSKVEPWCKACGEGELPSELQDLEDTIHHHQGLYEHITTAYSEVSTHIHTHIICMHVHTQVRVRNKCMYSYPTYPTVFKIYTHAFITLQSKLYNINTLHDLSISV